MIQKSSQSITFEAFYTASKQGKVGLTVTVDVYSPSGTLLVSSGPATETGGGFYRYTLAGGSTGTGGAYRAIFKTSDTSVDLQHVPSLWEVGVAGVDNLNAPVASVPASVWSQTLEPAYSPFQGDLAGAVVRAAATAAGAAQSAAGAAQSAAGAASASAQATTAAVVANAPYFLSTVSVTQTDTLLQNRRLVLAPLTLAERNRLYSFLGEGAIANVGGESFEVESLDNAPGGLTALVIDRVPDLFADEIGGQAVRVLPPDVLRTRLTEQRAANLDRLDRLDQPVSVVPQRVWEMTELEQAGFYGQQIINTAAAVSARLDAPVSSRLATSDYTPGEGGGTGGGSSVRIVRGVHLYSDAAGSDGTIEMSTGDSSPILLTLQDTAGSPIPYAPGSLTARLTDAFGNVVSENVSITEVEPDYGLLSVQVGFAQRGRFRLSVRRSGGPSDIVTFGPLAIHVCGTSIAPPGTIE